MNKKIFTLIIAFTSIFSVSAQEEVKWNQEEGVVINEITKSITKVDEDGWHSGIKTDNIIRANEDGKISYVINSLSVSMALGLSTKNTKRNLASMDYAIQLIGNNIAIYQHGKFKGKYGKAKVGDEISVERAGDNIYLKKNNRQIRKIKTNPEHNLFGELVIYKEGDVIQGDLKVNFRKPFKISYTKEDVNCEEGASGSIDLEVTRGLDIPIENYNTYTYQWSNGESTQDLNNLDLGRYQVVVTDYFGKKKRKTINILAAVTWTDLEGLKSDGGELGTGGSTGGINPVLPVGDAIYSLVKEVKEGQQQVKFKEGAAASLNTLEANKDGFLLYEIEDVNFTRVIGLAFENVLEKSYHTTDYAMFLSRKGLISIFEKGNYIGEFGEYTTGDEIIIERSGNFILYQKNGRVLRRVATDASKEMIIDIALLEYGATLNNVKTNFCELKYENFNGNYVIGAGGDYQNFSEAINDLHLKNINGEVKFLVKEGVYSESISLDKNINYTKDNDVFVSFVAENLETASSVLVKSENTALIIFEKENIRFVGIEFQSSIENVISLINSKEIELIKNNYLAINNSSADGIVGENVDGLSLLHSSFTNLRNGVKLSGENREVLIENNLFDPKESAVTINGFNNIRIEGNKFDNSNPSSFPLVSILNSLDTIIGDTLLQDSIIVTSNMFNNIGGGGMEINNFKSFVNISGNQFEVGESSSGIELHSFTGEVVINSNTINNPLGNAVRIGNSSSMSSVYENVNSEKNILIGNNQITALEIGIELHGGIRTNYLIINNSIDKCNKGLFYSNETIEDQSNYFINISGNLINSKGTSLDFQGVKGASILKSNTFVSNDILPTVLISNGDNIELCANNIVNLSNGNAIDFIGQLPVNFIQSFNNWYSFSGLASNNESLVLVGTFFSKNPHFINTDSEDIYERFKLSPRSGLLNKFTGCLDQINAFDLSGKVREEYYDIGAIESLSTNWDGLDIELVLDKGFIMYPEGEAEFKTLVIDGLENFTTIDLEIYSIGDGLYDELIFKTDSKTDNWNGIAENTNEIVNQGNYKYQLTLDGREVSGFIYVKRN